MNQGYSLVEATVLKAGPLKKLYVQYRCSIAQQRDGNVKPFTVNGDLLPKQTIPISSDIVSGTISTNGSSWVTYLNRVMLMKILVYVQHFTYSLP